MKKSLLFSERFRAIPMLGLLTISAIVNGKQPSAYVMADETREFLASMPDGLQKEQEEAVKKAIDGDYTALEKVRNSRNAKLGLPEGVMAQDIGSAYRLYRPSGCEKVSLPLLIYLHGGGWCFGSVNSCAHFCTQLVKEARVAVLAVDYPLAPENPFPRALDACTEAVSFAFKHAEDYGFDSEKISIGGDSAGGNLALSTALNLLMHKNCEEAKNIDRAIVPTLYSVVLFYPVVKAWADDSVSWHDYAEGYGLDAGLMEAFNAAYVGTEDMQNPLISPILAPEKLLRQIPKTLIVNAERDILFTQGKELAQKLSLLGVPVQHCVLSNTVHLFITVPGQLSAFRQSVRITTNFLQ